MKNNLLIITSSPVKGGNGDALACAGSTEEWLNAHVDSILTLGIISRCVEEYRTEMFNGCHGKDSCRGSKEALGRAENLTR